MILFCGEPDPSYYKHDPQQSLAASILQSVKTQFCIMLHSNPQGKRQPQPKKSVWLADDPDATTKQQTETMYEMDCSPFIEIP